MKKSVLVGLAMMIGAGGTAQAAEISCGENYLSKQGETIYQIVAKAYDAGIKRQLLVSILSQRHGNANAVLEPGTSVSIPCESGQGFEMPADYWADRGNGPITINIDDSDYRGLTAEADGDTPIILRNLIDQAFKRGELQAETRADLGQKASQSKPFPDTVGALDVSFPWRKSDCESASGDPQLCGSALWSDPLYDITSGAYTIEGAVAQSTDRLRYCIASESRSALWASGELDVLTFRRASDESAATCVTRMRAGAVDVVVMPDVAVIAENQATSGARLVRASDLSVSDTVHAVIDHRKSNSRVVLSRINRGIEALRRNGEWYEVIHAQLSSRLVN